MIVLNQSSSVHEHTKEIVSSVARVTQKGKHHGKYASALTPPFPCNWKKIARLQVKREKALVLTLPAQTKCRELQN